MMNIDIHIWVMVWGWLVSANVYNANDKYGYGIVCLILAIIFFVLGVMEW